MAVKSGEFTLHILMSCCLCGLEPAEQPVKIQTGWVEQEVTEGRGSHDKTSCGQLVKSTEGFYQDLINPVQRIRVANKVMVGSASGGPAERLRCFKISSASYGKAHVETETDGFIFQKLDCTISSISTYPENIEALLGKQFTVYQKRSKTQKGVGMPM